MNLSEITISLNGTTDLPSGKIAAIVTSLEMNVRPAPRPDLAKCSDFSLERISPDDIARYLAIYRVLGERWMWFSRLVMPRHDVAAILHDPAVEAFAVCKDGRDAGLLELDWRVTGACELAFFGLYEEHVGKGAGRWLMNRAIAKAWDRSITRFWVHTCSFDHQSALQFYQRSGFVPCRISVEIVDDPRQTGHLPLSAVAHCPIVLQS
jgi:GNAT superfamily N-acetyltransferase